MNLRHFFIALMLIISLPGLAQKNNEYIISGRINGIGNTKVLLGNKPKNGYSSAFKVQYFDSCYSKNDHFTFRGYTNELAFYSIEVPDSANGWISIILENKKIEITGIKDSIYRSRITGSPQNDVYNSYKTKIEYPLLMKKRIIYKVIDSLSKLNDTIEITQLEKKYLGPYNRKSEDNLYRFIEENPTNYGALYELSEISDLINIDSTRKYYLKFSEELKNTSLGKMLKYRLFEYTKLIHLKKPMPNFSMPDTAGIIINTSELRGKYILIDFWASWCGPCIDEMPKLKKIDSLYSSKGLQILGISMDTDGKLWREFIKKNKIAWLNLSDLQGSNNKAARLLNVESIPSTFLLDPEGNILFKNAPLSEIERFLLGWKSN
ncbi:TlpA disulfide reductase family protein [Chitinophaga sp. OAE865]|uniref:redoxin domain-containing protein n=1 Tax=Chitinophaga sp. OAE865 TaxID=2817898 RepID=UPI001AE430FF